ncbi:putative spore germination protein YfkR [Paenibacillus glycanilyticus]|uniref:Spore germination protein YfkR n=1 Tax=Paenibacillus glycanilyticus TaxID=126569 RepID=A0ABQ6NHL8_9BACL|nr:Ger(x)C family spore germination protein [Paenibacillus glycanilyticus]GMK44570.1 putative spore germination protein YfkR [Paenibacillus glycanilyticus]
MRTLKGMFLLLVVFSLSGCWDRMEINDLAFVTGTALDVQDDGSLFCTLQIAIPGSKEGAGGGGKGDSGSFYLISASGNSGNEVHRALQKKSSRQLFYSHRSVVFISERLARQGINGALLDVFTHDPRNRLKTYVMIVKGGEARQILELNYPLKQVPLEVVNEMQRTGDEVAVTLRDLFIANQSEGIQPVLGVLELGDRPGDKKEQIFKTEGTGVLKGMKLTGILDEKETQCLMWLMNKLKFGRITAQLPKDYGQIGYMLNHTTSKIITHTEQNKVRFNIALEGTGTVEENNSPLDISDPSQMAIIKQAMEDSVKKQAEQLLLKLQKKYKADSVGFGQEIYKNNPGKWKALKKEWDAEFQNASITVEVNLTVIGAGMVHSTLQHE